MDRRSGVRKTENDMHMPLGTVFSLKTIFALELSAATQLLYEIIAVHADS